MSTNGVRKILMLTIMIMGVGFTTTCAPISIEHPSELSQTVESLEITQESATKTEPAPIAAEEIVPEVTAVPAERDFFINEDVHRGPLFNINTLAYKLPGMDQVEVVNVTYARPSGQLHMTMDVYYPPDTPEGAHLPTVIFGMGYRRSRQALRNAHFYTSWGRLVAAAGMAAIVYDTEHPNKDIDTLMNFIGEHAETLRVDPTQIGFMSTSANVPTVMSYLMQERKGDIQFSIYYYGLSLTPDQKYKEQFAQQCSVRGCLVSELSDVSFVDPDLPLLIVIAGQDDIHNINEGMYHFVDFVQAAGAPVTLIDYEEGEHGFDTQQKTEESAEIIAQTVEFMQVNFGLE